MAAATAPAHPVIRHYLHVYADGPHWRQAVDDHLLALHEAKPLINDMVVGLVGRPERRVTAAAYLKEGLADLPIANVTCLAADEGYEQVTLAPLRAWARSASAETLVLYTHSKGAANPSRLQMIWRRSMEIRLVARLEEAVAAMENHTRLDAVGSHWLTKAEYPRLVERPFFGGNYWLARASYLALLPELGPERHDAENWIGRGNPNVLDLLPGWPGIELCMSSGNLGEPVAVGEA